MTTVSIKNNGVDKAFENLIGNIASDIVNDVCTLSNIEIVLVKDERNQQPVFARANTYDFLKGNVPMIQISPAILWYAKTLEAIVSTVAHEMGHLELASKYAPAIYSLGLSNDFHYQIANIWSDALINSYLVTKGYGPSLIAQMWETSDGNMSLFIYATSKRKPLNRQDRRDRVVDLIVDFSELLPLLQDKRIEQFSLDTWERIKNTATRMLSQKPVTKVEKIVKPMLSSQTGDWIKQVEKIVQEVK